MPFDVTPTNPLAKIFTLKMVVNTAIQQVKAETQQDINPEFVKTLANVVILDVAEFLSGAGSDDYGKTVNISDDDSSVTGVIIIGGSYTDATKTIAKTAHGIVAADIGKRIVYFSDVGIGEASTPAPLIIIAEIESITDLDNFVVTKPAGEDIASIQYGVFSAHSGVNYDMSGLRIAAVTKIQDSINGEIVKTGDKQFDNLPRFDERQNQISWYKHGQTIFFYIGTDIANVGTWTLFYNSYPQIFTDEDQLVDIRDNYVPLVIYSLTNKCIEQITNSPSGSLEAQIDKKKSEIRSQIQSEKAIIDQKSREATPH